jgi:hypothetical protein
LATYWPIVPSLGDNVGEFGEMMIIRRNRSTGRKPSPVPICPPPPQKNNNNNKIAYDLTGREIGPPLWEASDYPLEVMHGQRVWLNYVVLLLQWKLLVTFHCTSNYHAQSDFKI